MVEQQIVTFKISDAQVLLNKVLPDQYANRIIASMNKKNFALTHYDYKETRDKHLQYSVYTMIFEKVFENGD